MVGYVWWDLMTEVRPSSERPNPRMHQGGKLSFRRRVRHAQGDKLPICYGGEAPPYLEELVPDNYQQQEIEVGPGKGAFLLAATDVDPDTFYLGIEAAPAYAEYAAERLSKHGRENGMLLVDNAKIYLQDRVAEGSLDRLHVYYPDPWPKRRHRGRRFFTEEMPPVIHRVLKADAYLLVATDNPAYAGRICRVLGQSPLLRRDRQEEERLLLKGPGYGFSPTNFEKKYIEQGRVLRRYAFQRLP